MAKSKLIGVFSTEISSRVQCNVYTALNEEASKYGYHLALFSGTYEHNSANKTAKETSIMFNMARNMDLAALFICAQPIGKLDIINEVISIGKEKRIPIFLYDCENIGINASDDYIVINPNYEQGFEECVRHVIEHHRCKNIVMLAGIKGNKYSDERIDAYKKQMEAHKLPYTEESIIYGDFWEIPAMEAVKTLLDSGKRLPDAICCANDSMALAAIKVLNSRGIKIPKDVIITGFDGIEDGKYSYPTLSTCEFDYDAVAKFVFDSIIGLTDTKDYLIPLKYVAKESCGCKYNEDVETRKEMGLLLEGMQHSTRQSHMLYNMQVELIDSYMIDESAGHMHGTLGLFDGYQHLMCIRDDIELLSDYTKPFEKMRVHMNYYFYEEQPQASFDVEKIFPDWNYVVANLKKGEALLFRLIHCKEKVYGYFISKTNKIVSNELRLMGNFMESATSITETILRNYRLKQANEKLNEMYDQLAEVYIRDTMTGLFNRHGYYKMLDEYMCRADLKDGYIHIMSIDMDGMKFINDNFGHHEGDNAIKAVATTIKDCFAQPCVSARFGGDEFMVAIFTDGNNIPSVEKLSEKLNSYIRTLPMLADKEYPVGVSIGQASKKISEVKELKSLESMADASMYENKRMRKAAR